jgi:tetratricopeptide (TPR) repeat protein
MISRHHHQIQPEHSSAEHRSSSVTSLSVRVGFTKRLLQSFLALALMSSGAVSSELTEWQRKNNDGVRKLSSKDYLGACVDFSKAHEIAPKAEIPLLNRAKTKALLNDYAGALEDFDVAIKLEPDDYFALYGRAHVHEKLKNYQDALADYDTLIARFQSSRSKLLHERGLLKKRIGDKKGAREDFQREREILKSEKRPR